MRLPNPNIVEDGRATRWTSETAPKSPGRPEGSGPNALRTKLEQYLNLSTPVILPDGTKDKRAVIDATVLALLHKATRGDIQAIKEVFDRHYGKLADKVELTGKDGESLKIEQTSHLSHIYDGIKDAFSVEAIEEK